MLYSRVTVVVVGVFLVASGTTAKECTHETINTCFEPMKNASGNNTGSPIVPTRSSDEMKQLCSDYDDFAECMKPIKPNCQEIDQLVFEGIDNYYGYFCDLKFDEYLKHRECFKQGKLHEEGKYCNSTFTTRLLSLKNQGYSTSYIRDRICQYVEDYLDCVENVVTSFCGKEAALWQRGLDVSSLMPLLNRISCPGWPTEDKYNWRLPNKGTPTNAIIILVVVFFVLLLLAVGALIVMKLSQMKKRNQRQTAPDETTVPPYVSYDRQGVYMYPPAMSPVENPEGATAAGPLPTKAPPYAESLPPAYDSSGYDNPVYGAHPAENLQPTEQVDATEGSNATATAIPSKRQQVDEI